MVTRLAVFRSLLTVWLIAAVTGCGLIQPEPERQPTLYEELGAQPGIDRLNERLILNIARDARIRDFFRGVDIERFHRMLGEHLCDISDGPCRYSGDSMRLVHAGMGVDDGAFNALVENLVRAMEAESIAIPVQNRLLRRLAPLHSEVVAAPLPDASVPGTDLRDIDGPELR